MKLALLNLLRVVMSLRHSLPIFLFTLVSLNLHAQCPPTVTAMPSSKQEITATSATICSGDSAQLNAAPSTGTTWQWYKDGVLIPGATKSTYYGMDNANYTVLVGGCASLSPTFRITLKPLPVLNIIASATALCDGQQVNLFVNAGANVGWVWIGPNDNPIYLTNTNPVTPNVTTTTTFQVVGGSTITGCAATDAVTIVVYPILVPAGIQSDDHICPGETPHLITSTPPSGSSGIYTYQWQSSTTSATTGFTNIPGATSPTYQPGPTSVTTWYRLATISAPCGTENSNAVVVQVNPFPILTSPPPKSICSGNNVNYQPTSNVGGTTYKWTASLTSGTVSGFSPTGNGKINDVLLLPAGSTTSGKVTYVITPYGPAPSSCPGTPKNLVVTVNPLPLVTNSPLSQDICAGTFTTPIILLSNLAGTSFTWTATATPGISGYTTPGSGNILSRQIFSSLLVVGTIKYTITPHGPSPASCDGPSVVYTVNVNPSPSITVNPMQQTICTGDKTTAVTLTSNVASTTFTWTASAVPASVSGYQTSGTSTLPAQTITNPSNVPGLVTYHIIPSGSLNGCPGVPADYVITVNPKPIATATPPVLTICSGDKTNIALSSTVAGTTFNWVASSPFAITGFSDGNGSSIKQTLSNNTNAPRDVTYVITPTANGCVGDPINVVVTVNPEMKMTVVPPSTCSGNNLNINLVGNMPGIAFSWTATPVGNVTGYSDGTGTTISQTLVNHDDVTRTVVYSVTMSKYGCDDGPNNFSVTVYPEPRVTNNPLKATQCSGDIFNLALTSNVAGATFTWTANGASGISGFVSGGGSTINHLLQNSSNAPGTVVYTITPSANGCAGTPVDYVVTVNPIPTVNLSLASQSICSGSSTLPVTLSSPVAGTTFTWTASPSGSGISGYTASGSAIIPSQVINSTLSVQGAVTYKVTPSFSGCTGPTSNHIVTINPIPQVINAPMSQTICSGATSANVNLLSNVAGTTFTWIATASSTSVTGFTASGGNTIPAQTIYNYSTTVERVSYQVIPTSNFGPNCPGPIATYTINVQPLPSINSNLSASVCSGQSLNYSITSNLAGTTFTWTRAAVSGISNPTASGSTSGISETLINTTNFDIDVEYILTPTGQALTFCTGNSESLIVKVKALPQVNAGPDLTIPYGTFTTLNGSANGGTGALTSTWTPGTYIGSGINTLTPQTINLNITRTYTLTVNDAAGCSANDQATVFVNGSPLAVAPTATPSTVCVGESSVLDPHATGGSGTYTYLWTSMPAGFTSTATNPSVTPLVTTVYTVTANDGFNSVSASVTVTVNPLPTKYILTGGGSYCLGGSGVVVGLAGSESGVNYQLYNNGNPVGTPILGNGAPVSFGNQTAAGIYTARATRISTSCSQDMGSSVLVSINPLPVPDAGLDQIITYGTNTTLFGTSTAGTGPYNYAWEPSAFISSGQNTFSPTTTNVYSNITYTLNVIDSKGCAGSDQVAVSLSGSAINIIAISGPDEICADSSLAQLTAIVTGGTGSYTYLWTSNPPSIPVLDSTDQNPIVSPDVTTIYTVTVSDGFNSAVASANILVHPLPLLYSITGGGAYCFAGSGASIGLSGSEPFTNYQLYRGGVADGPPVTGNGSPISFGNRTASFTYTVVATKNITGCTEKMNGSTTVTIVPPPTQYVVTGGGSYPFGGPGREIGLMHGDNGISYQLYYNNTPIGTPVTGVGTSINFGYQTQAGTYTVVGTDSVTGCTADMSGSVDITILPLPVIYSVTGGGLICLGEPGLQVGLTGSEGGIDYQILLDGLPFGPVVPGTNSPLDWSPISTSGLFEVRAVNPITGITQMMNDSAVIIVNPALTIFSVDPIGSQCPGTIIRLNGSEAGNMYFLMLNGIVIDTIVGTGVVGFLDFGPQTINGTYTISAVNMTTGCKAMMNGSTYISIAPKIFTVIPAGILCPGQDIILDGSEPGVNYQLRWNGTFDLGAPVAGTGLSIIVGTVGLPGVYSVIATNATTNCVSYMNDSATVYPDPTVYTIVPDGPACEGDIIGLNGSELGVDYVLLLDNAIHLDTISGTGLPISFGPQMTAGNYTVLAINQTTYCIFPMAGTTVMNDSPIQYSVQPAGIQCVGNIISLSGSQPGITYQLMLDGLYNMGAPVAGTGSAISFGAQNLTGTYTVRAVNDLSGCNSIMADSTIFQPLPVAFTVTPSGSYCAGASIGLNGTQLNTNYILVLDGSIHLDTIAGNGGSIDFGPQTTAGTYSIVAYNTATFCSNTMNGSPIIKATPVQFNITPAGSTCAGGNIGLDNSEIGASYQLRLNGIINIGSAVAGTGSAISFGAQTVPGIYTAIATNPNGCSTIMIGSVLVNPNPVAYNITPDALRCPGTEIGIDGSEPGISYMLVLDGAIHLDTLAGTGSALSFGIQTTSGTYSIIAFNDTTLCQKLMNGNTIIKPAPIAYNLTPAGISCVGTVIGLDNSETGVSYQLRLNGSTNIGSPVAGTGSAISFGVQTIPGTYTVEASGSNGCTNMMSNSVVINPGPTVFTQLPAGSQCPGTVISLNGSQTGIKYVLVRDGIFFSDTLTGTGSVISFGKQSITGTYTIVAFSAVTSCPAVMNSNTTILVGPTAFNVTPAGIICAGSTIGLDGSDLGITYQLRRDGITNIGAPVDGTGSAITFGAIITPGNYTIIGTSTLNGCATVMNGNAVLQPLPLAYSITSPGVQCAGTSIILNGSEIGIDYVLVLDNTFNIDTIAGTGTMIDFGPQAVTGIYTVVAISGTSNCRTLMNGSTTIMAYPTAFNTTPSGLTCESAIVGLTSSETGVDYILYNNGINTGISIAGTGNAISFGELYHGVYSIKAVNQTSTCSIFMIGTIEISSPAVVKAGLDETICTTGTAGLNATVTNNSGVATWSTSGDGTFNDVNSLTAIYTPGTIDKAAGIAYLVLTTKGSAGCATTTATDTVELTINQLTTADAGGDIDVCTAGGYIIKGASAVHYNAVSWTSSGSGTFANANTIAPTYTPSASDIAAGSVLLTMNVTGTAPCSNNASDVITMNFHPTVTVYAGPDASINYGSLFNASDASVQNSTAVKWTTTGSGTFNNNAMVNATYTPSIADFAQGSVVLSLAGINNASCAPVIDNLTLTLTNIWNVEFTWGATCDSQPVEFTVNTEITNAAAVASWLWDFGDGTTSALMNPTHLFPGIGAYTVILTATDTNGFDRATSHPIYISQFPVAFFSSSIPNCSNELVNFTDLAHTLYGYIDQWRWNYGDGSANDTIHFPDEPNVAHLYNAAGIFNVSLTVINSSGCISSTTIPVDVIEAPVTNFQYTDDCSGLETAFRDASYANGPGNTIQYWWNFGDPSTGSNNYSDLKDATHIFSAPGTYQITHVVRNFNNCTDTIVKPVVILIPVPVDFVHGFTCVNGITNFSPDTSIMNIADITSWLWNFGDGVTNDQQYTNHSFDGPGTYQVKLTVVSISGCTASKTHTIVVNPLPVAIFDATQITCENVPVHFDDASSTYAGFITKWTWDFGDGNTQQISYPANSDTDHAYSAPGTYTVKLSIISSDSCTAEYVQTIVIKPAPNANFAYAKTCQGSPVQFTDLTQLSGAGIINGWNWNFGDDASGSTNVSILQNPKHVYSSTGTYQVSLTVSAANGCSSTFIRTLIITEAPFADFSFDHQCTASAIQFTHASSMDTASISSWNWSFGDGLSSTLANPQHSYSIPGNYTVTLTITNATGCENSVSKTISILPVPISKFSTDVLACSQYEVGFFNQSSAAVGYIIRWEYNFGDGTSKIINYPDNPATSHTYNTFGTYTATLTVITNNNCQATSSKTVQVLPSPLANFGYNVSCLDVPVQFNDLSQGNLVSWTWNFGDPGSLSNNLSNQQNPQHSYQQAGNYLVTLEVKNANGCHDTITRIISIAPKPSIDFSFNNGCATDTVNFNSSTYVDVSTASWFWQFGDNTTSVDVDPYHIYATPGTYSVSLTVTNKNGCTNVRTRQVQVTTAPIAIFTSSSLSCSGTAVLFSDLSSTSNGTISSWNWNFDDGTSTVITEASKANVAHTFASAGIYHVTLTIHTSTGCEASYSNAVKVNPSPVTAFSYSNSCAELPTSFVDHSQGSGGNSIIGWSWNFGDPVSGAGNTSTIQNPQHLFTGTGAYNVTLTTENSKGCVNSVMQVVTITSGPAVDFFKSSSCSNSSTSFVADPILTQIAEVVSYLWDFGDGTSPSTLPEPSHVYTQAGNYSVTLTITNIAGCKNSISHNLTVQASPSAQFAYSGNCAGNRVQFTDNSYNAGGNKIVSWAWDFGVSNSSTDVSSIQNPSFDYTSAGTYNVTLTITSLTGCNSTKVMQVTILAAPEAKFSYTAEACHNGSVQFKDESTCTQSSIKSWYWEFAPGVYSTTQNPTYIFGNSDTCYDVKLVVTTSNGCTNTLIKKVCIPTGIDVAINNTQSCFGEGTWFSSTLIKPAGAIITSYSWNFGDPTSDYNNQSKLASPEHIFSKPGTYIVSLKVTDISNCITSRYMSVTVDPLPNASFSYSGGECDSLVNFKDETNGRNIARWIWNFGDGKSKIVDAPANPNVNHYYTYPGVYGVTLITLNESGCSDTIVKTIRRTPCIAASFKVSDPVVCQKRSMKFNETSTCQAPIASWQWFFGDNTSVTYTNPKQVVEHTYAVPGNYKVTMVVATNMVGGMVTDTASNQVSVKPAAKAAYQWQDVCVGTSTLFDNQTQSNNTTIKSYSWNFGDPGSFTDTTSTKQAEYRYDVFGTYDVKLVVTNTLGCTDTIINKVHIFESPLADFTWNNSCESKPVHFVDNSEATTSDIVKWNWKFIKDGDIIDGSTQRNCTYNFAHAGDYEANMMVTDKNGCSTNISKLITIYANPVAAFSIVENYENTQGQIMISNGTIDGIDNEWEISNGKTSYATNPVITFDKEGHYTIQLTTRNEHNCTDTVSMAYDFMYKGLYVPNAFNPGNVSPEVAIFKPKGTNLKLYSIGVYDRWGNLLWSSNKIDSKGSPAESWDGTWNGKEVQQDVYVWKIDAQFNDGQVWDGKNTGNNENMPQMKSGTVTLLR